MIPGLTYVDRFVNGPDEVALLDALDAESWLVDLKRRVQHYGYRYDYKARKVTPSMDLGPLPAWARSVAGRLVAAGHMPEASDQLIVNEYEPGQGIAAHIDCVPCFGAVICSISLGSSCLMQLSATATDDVESLLLEPGSLLVLAGAACYDWRHVIPARKSDRVADQIIQRHRRVSLTFRTMIAADA